MDSVAIITDNEGGPYNSIKNIKPKRHCEVCSLRIRGKTVFLSCKICNQMCCWECATLIEMPFQCEQCRQRCHDGCAPMCQGCNRSACADCFGNQLICPHANGGCDYKGCEDCYDDNHDCIEA